MASNAAPGVRMQCHIPCNSLAMRNAEKTVFGDALKISILILESANNDGFGDGFSGLSNKRVITFKLAAQNEKYLNHVLNLASPVDATYVLVDDRITSRSLSNLYSWMVERPQLDRLSYLAFEIFALALQRSRRWSASVELEQQFSSRALQKYKQERKDKSILLQEIKDEADEL